MGEKEAGLSNQLSDYRSSLQNTALTYVIASPGGRLISLLITLIAIIAGLIYFRRRKSLPSNIPPGNLGLPFVGETFSFLSAQRANKSYEFFQQRVAKYGDVFATPLLGYPTVIMHGASANKFLHSNENKLLQSSWPASTIKLLGKHTLVALHGAEHKHRRQIVMTCLTPDTLQRFVGRVDELTQRHFSEHWEGKEEVTMFPLIKMHTFSLACSLFMSLEEWDRNGKLADLFKTLIAGLFSFPIDFPGTRYNRAKKARMALLPELHRLTWERRKNIEDGPVSEMKDLLSILIAAKDEIGNLLSQEQILDTLITLLFAGHDTSASAIAAACMLLVENPTCWEEIIKEQSGIAAQKNQGEKLCWEDIQKMKYTWRVIQEAIRVMPPVGGGFKMAIKDFEYGGYTIPKGWKLHYSIIFTNMNEKIFPNPTKFDPSRFEGTGPPPFAFMPFGGGPHICPGNEFARMVILVFFHHLGLRYKMWNPIDPSERFTIDPMPYPINGLNVKLTKN